jgi:hypothetical protein
MAYQIVRQNDSDLSTKRENLSVLDFVRYVAVMTVKLDGTVTLALWWHLGV